MVAPKHLADLDIRRIRRIRPWIRCRKIPGGELVADTAKSDPQPFRCSGGKSLDGMVSTSGNTASSPLLLQRTRILLADVSDGIHLRNSREAQPMGQGHCSENADVQQSAAPYHCCHGRMRIPSTHMA
jgi:hypothetical protein